MNSPDIDARIYAFVQPMVLELQYDYWMISIQMYNGVGCLYHLFILILNIAVLRRQYMGQYNKTKY